MLTTDDFEPLCRRCYEQMYAEVCAEMEEEDQREWAALLGTRLVVDRLGEGCRLQPVPSLRWGAFWAPEGWVWKTLWEFVDWCQGRWWAHGDTAAQEDDEDDEE
jgi:hypothetical protein